LLYKRLTPPRFWISNCKRRGAQSGQLPDVCFSLFLFTELVKLCHARGVKMFCGHRDPR